MKNPKIYLAIDNCFASKRWTTPLEWMGIIKDMGINYVEANADTECDPLYMGEEYIVDWVKSVKEASEKTGVKVCNIYSGHGTYATLGLAHTNSKVRQHFLNEWIKPMCDIAGELNAGLGFFCHAFSNSVLQNPALYEKYTADLCDTFARIADYAAEHNCVSVGVEQMYSPHQIPWTLEGTKKLLSDVNNNAQNPFYITIDTGHQSGQHKFLRPSHGEIKDALASHKTIWLGASETYNIFNHGAADEQTVYSIETNMNKYPYMFALEEDSDTYKWIELFGSFSPIIHLQQSDGYSSSHCPFTYEFNKSGLIKGEQVLKSIKKAYKNYKSVDYLIPCESIYLTLEIFSGTSETTNSIINKITESVKYWRKFIPRDGMTLDELEEITYKFV